MSTHDTNHRAEDARTLAEISPDELRDWLRRLKEARIVPEALVAAATALDMVRDAEEQAREMAEADDLPEGGWSASDELEAAFEASRDDAWDDVVSFWRDARAAGAVLGVMPAEAPEGD